MVKYAFKDLILFEDHDYIIINKPSQISTLDERSGSGSSILEMARSYVPMPQVCHRLDKETTGALAIAKNPEAYRALSMQFEDRKVKKEYHAICDGLHNFRELSVKEPILIMPKGHVKIDHRQGKPAETIFDTLKTFKSHTLVSCRPITGRMHQIRIHLSSINAPISGDEQYGGKYFYLSTVKKKFNLKKGTDELPLFRRVALHAYALTFTNMRGEEVEALAPYPKDLTIFLNQLEKNL